MAIDPDHFRLTETLGEICLGKCKLIPSNLIIYIRMIDWESKRTRYIRQPLNARFGALAANLARVHSFSDNPDHDKVVSGLLNESRYFIEWTIKDAEFDFQEKLIEFQLEMSIWMRTWERLWPDPASRSRMASDAKEWSESILKRAGFYQ